MAVAKPALPEKVQLGPYTYSVITDQLAFQKVQVEERELICGRQKTTSQEIHVNPEMAPDCTKDTVIHECLHHFFSVSGLRQALEMDDRTEEAIVNFLGGQVLSMLRDNPELVRWLTA